MAAGNAAVTVNICAEIFKWGGVDRKGRNKEWLRAKGKDIISDINDAVTLLNPSCTDSLAPFDGRRLRMNSAMTKVYAAADRSQQVIIYDGRVGAAVCLLVRRYLKGIGAREVPVDLQLLWGPPQTEPADRRNPSNHTFTFGKLNGYGVTDERRAEVCRVASGILSVVARGFSLRDIEKGLFMIGYAVRSPWATTLL